MSEWDPLNHTSLILHVVCFKFSSVGPSLPNTYSGKNLTRCSSRARAWRKAQTLSSFPFVVPGRVLSRTKPIDETVSLAKQPKLLWIVAVYETFIAYHAPMKCTRTSFRENVALKCSHNSRGFTFFVGLSLSRYSWYALEIGVSDCQYCSWGDEQEMAYNGIWSVLPL